MLPQEFFIHGEPKLFAVETAKVATLMSYDSIDLLVHSQGKFDDVQYISSVLEINYDHPEDQRTIWVTARDRDGFIDLYLHGEITLQSLWASCDTFLQQGPCWQPGQQLGIQFDLVDDGLDEEFWPGSSSYFGKEPEITKTCECGNVTTVETVPRTGAVFHDEDDEDFED